MRRLLSYALVIALAGGPLAGCIVRTRGHHHHHHGARKAPRCNPGHHWDGHQCRNRGNGKVKRDHRTH
jgi:hypothetical protein